MEILEEVYKRLSPKVKDQSAQETYNHLRAIAISKNYVRESSEEEKRKAREYLNKNDLSRF